MPIYEFVCSSCQKKIEVVRPMNKSGDPELCKCGKMMDRVFSVPGSPRIWKLEKSLATGKPVKNKQDYINQLKAIGANVSNVMDNPY